MSDYAEHVVALQHLAKALSAALRDKRYSEADHIAAEAMKRLARIHGYIARAQG